MKCYLSKVNTKSTRTSSWRNQAILSNSQTKNRRAGLVVFKNKNKTVHFKLIQTKCPLLFFYTFRFHMFIWTLLKVLSMPSVYAKGILGHIYYVLRFLPTDYQARLSLAPVQTAAKCDVLCLFLSHCFLSD